MGIVRNLIGAAAAFAAAAGCATAPDLTISRLSVSPAETAPGAEIEIVSGIMNTGDGPARPPIAIDVDLFASESDLAPLTRLTAWQETAGPLPPGTGVEDATKVRAPINLAPGGYVVCAFADPEDRVAESDEDNNRRCAPFALLSGPIAAADLVIEKVTPLDQAQASRMVKVKIRNAGSAPAAGPFRVMAFKRSPRQPLLLIECPLTEGQLAAGSPASCPDLQLRTPLAPGAAAELTGYFAYVVANGADFLRQPLRPDDKKPLVSRTVDFMVDGCFPPEDGRPVWCAVEEIDEINNFKGATLKVR